MASAEIITIGTELLLGEIVDTNSRFIARNLRDAGIDLYRKTSIGDNVRRIAEAIRESMQRSDIIITTGGLGPTVDDPTREATALAIGVETEFRPELWEQIQERFRRFNSKPTENNKRQAYVPKGAIAIENPVGTAPAFILEVDDKSIISLPGVPKEMSFLLINSVLPYLKKKYNLHGIIKARVLHTAGAGESEIDERIADLETLSNPTVGLAAHSGQVDVRITAKAGSEPEADQLILEVETKIRKRLGTWAYGVDDETLEEVALRAIANHGWTLSVIEAGLQGELIRRLAQVTNAPSKNLQQVFLGGEVLTSNPSLQEIATMTEQNQETKKADVSLGVAVIPGGSTQNVFIAVISPFGSQNITRPYGGPPGYAHLWAVHHSLNLLRNL